eukprot:IDg23121t1
MRSCHSSPNSACGMSSTDLEFLFSVRNDVSCSIPVGFCSDLFGRDLSPPMIEFVSIFSTLDKGIAVSIVHKGWGNACPITCPLWIRMGVSPKFSTSIWNGRLGLTHSKKFDVLTVFADPNVLCGDMMILPEYWVVTVTHCWVSGCTIGGVSRLIGV